VRIEISTIPHAEQRYPTCGDWFFLDDAVGSRLIVRVSDMGNPRFEALVGYHEAFEALLCKNDGVTDEMVTAFDTLYERVRDVRLSTTVPGPGEPTRETFDAQLLADYGCACAITEDSEPGDDKHAPYHLQHGHATAVERHLAAALGIAWSDYADAVDALFVEPDHPVAQNASRET
jgi:hypothetical protein